MQRHAAHAQLFFKFTRCRLAIAFIGLDHATGGHIPVAWVDRLAQGAAVHAQLTRGIEQQNVGAAADQAALTQLRPGQGAQELILFIDPGDGFGVGGRAMGGLGSGDRHALAL
ncbi:hypothetical protein D3C86_1845890 [compost metagenome]